MRSEPSVWALVLGFHAAGAELGWQGRELGTRSEGSRLDVIPSITIVDLGLCAATSGAVDAFEAFLTRDTATHNASAQTDSVDSDQEMLLQVWRPGSGRPTGRAPSTSSHGWRLVDQVQVSWEASAFGTVTFFDLSRTPLPMSVGDCIGWHAAGIGAVPYDVGGANTADSIDGSPVNPGVIWAYGRRVVRIASNEPAVANGWGDRKYSIRVHYRPLGSNADEPAALPEARAQKGAPADVWLPRDLRPPVCTENGALQVACPASESSHLVDAGPIDWHQILYNLCMCTGGDALVGGAVATTGACCDLDTLDRVLNGAAHPQSVACLQGVLSVLAACSAKLSLRHRPGTLFTGVASGEIRAVLKRPRLVHLASPVRLLEAPVAQGPRLEEDLWDLVIQPVLAEDGQRHTFRLRGAISQATFAPFPFGMQDLMWWRSALAQRDVDVLAAVVLGLSVSGVPITSFVGSLRHFASGRYLGEPMDALVPWTQRENVRDFAQRWSAAAPAEHHFVEFPRHMELGVLPDASLRALWPSDFSFKIVCPNCAYVVIYFHFTPADGRVVTTYPGPPCAWPSSIVFPPVWMTRSKLLAATQGKATRPLEFGEQEGDLVELPWPAEARQLLDLEAKYRDAVQQGTGPAARLEIDELRQATLGSCWPDWVAAAQADSVSPSELSYARITKVAPEFDLGPKLRPGMGLYDLYDLRKEVSSPELEALADKVALKDRLLAEGLPVASVFHASYETPEVRHVLSRHDRYAVKAAHRHHGGRGVVLVERGTELRTGKPITVEEVQAKIMEMWPPDPMAGQPHCVEVEEGSQQMQCVNNAPMLDKELRPAVIVEELAVTWNGRRDVLADEAFCFTAWGRVCLCGVMGPGGVWAGYFTRDGTPFFGQTMHKEMGSRDISEAAHRAPIPWPVSLREEVVALAERTAVALAADLIRVDVFPNSGRPVIAEVSIVSGWLGRANLEWGEIDSWLLGLLGDRWLEGYGQSQGRIGGIA